MQVNAEDASRTLVASGRPVTDLRGLEGVAAFWTCRGSHFVSYAVLQHDPSRLLQPGLWSFDDLRGAAHWLGPQLTRNVLQAADIQVSSIGGVVYVSDGGDGGAASGRTQLQTLQVRAALGGSAAAASATAADGKAGSGSSGGGDSEIWHETQTLAAADQHVPSAGLPAVGSRRSGIRRAAAAAQNGRGLVSAVPLSRNKIQEAREVSSFLLETVYGGRAADHRGRVSAGDATILEIYDSVSALVSNRIPYTALDLC